MKKLMIAAAIVCAAACANAAMVSWYAVNLYGHDGLEANDLAVYFVDSAAYSQSTLTTALKAADFSFTGNTKVYASWMPASEGYASIEDVGSYGDMEEVTGYYVMFDTEELAKAKHFYMSSEKSVMANHYFEFKETGSQTASNWQAINTPEPTSGLLMLLGMAGLCLRRKQRV